PFRLTCPRCKTPNNSEARFCTSPGCGFPIGDMPLAQRSIRDARVALARNRREQASRFLADALAWWPDHPEAGKLQAALRDQEEREQQALRTVERALGQNACAAGRSALEDLRRIAPEHPRIAELEDRLTRGLAEADADAARGRRLEQQGRFEEAVQAYSAAL